MEKYIVKGGNSLEGEIEIQSAKNSVLCLLSCCVLTDEKVVIKKCPKIYDVFNMIKILTSIGCKVEWIGSSLEIDCSGMNRSVVPENYSKAMRSSIFLLGPLVAKMKQAAISYPGGCDIGLRPIDLHIKGLKALGVNIVDEGGVLSCTAETLVGTTFQLDYPSVGATENLMMAATLAKGRTIVKNAAKEPEIMDLQRFINALGGKVFGAGSSTIVIEGVKKLHGAEFTPIADRIVGGTYLIAGAITGGKLEIKGVHEEDIYSLIVKLRESACKIHSESDKIYIEAPERCKAIHIIETSPYPGFPTDLQAQIMALETVSEGTCILQENLFETRFKHVGELSKLGANITLRGRIAVIEGVERLRGGKLTAYDLRGGAALVIAGLKAEGITEIECVHHIERGYENIISDLKLVGADIIRV